MKSKIQKFYIILLVTGCWLLATASTQAASLYFSPSEGNYHFGENFIVRVNMTTDTAVNAVSGTIVFPTEYLEVIVIDSQSNTDSIIDLWTQKPSFSNAGQNGNINFEGLVLNPGFTGVAGKVIGISFRVKKIGTAKLTFSSFSILANDGLGTNIGGSITPANFSLLPKTNIPPSVEELQTQKEAKTIARKITEIEGYLQTLGQPQPNETLRYWQILPFWIQISILALVSIASIILLFAILSFGIIILVWILSNVWRRRKDFTRLLKYVILNIKILFGKTLIALRLAEKEFVDDVYYAIEELKKDLKKAEKHPSFSKITKDYWTSILRIIKRFFTKDSVQNGAATQDVENLSEKKWKILKEKNK